MPILCSHCGYANELNYRFCGMCGTSLAEPTTEAGQSEAASGAASPTESVKLTGAGSSTASESKNDAQNYARGVSGSSFFGLDEPRSDLHYLLQDEDEEQPHRGRKRMLLALVILLIAGLALAWRSYGWRIPDLSRNASAVPASSSPPSQADGAPADKQKPAGALTETDLPSANGTTTPAEASPPPSAHSVESSEPRATGGAASDATEKSGAEKTAPPVASESGSDAPPATAQSPLPASHPQPRPEPPHARAKPSPVVSAPSDSDALAAEGEKYLYGSGVSQNCGRAQKSLLSAAGLSNAHAQSVLGTMYATGHCVSRDLPAAYRWFAKALRQDPNNSRISRDLEILWKQMTPEEKQLASAKQ